MLSLSLQIAILTSLLAVVSFSQASVPRLKNFNGEYGLQKIEVVKAKDKQALAALIASNKTETGFNIIRGQQYNYLLGSQLHEINSCPSKLKYQVADGIPNSDEATDNDVFEVGIGDLEYTKEPDLHQIPVNSKGQTTNSNLSKFSYRSSSIVFKYAMEEGDSVRTTIVLNEKNGQITLNALVGEWKKDEVGVGSSLLYLGEVNCVYQKSAQ